MTVCRGGTASRLAAAGCPRWPAAPASGSLLHSCQACGAGQDGSGGCGGFSPGGGLNGPGLPAEGGMLMDDLSVRVVRLGARRSSPTPQPVVLV